MRGRAAVFLPECETIEISVGTQEKETFADGWCGAEIFAVFRHAIDGQQFKSLTGLEHENVPGARRKVNLAVANDRRCIVASKAAASSEAALSCRHGVAGSQAGLENLRAGPGIDTGYDLVREGVEAPLVEDGCRRAVGMAGRPEDTGLGDVTFPSCPNGYPAAAPPAPDSTA